MAKLQKERYVFLKTGYASFPLKDIGKKFEIIDTIDIEIKKPELLSYPKKEMVFELLHVNYKNIEKAVWEEIRKNHKGLLKEADWLVISIISEFMKSVIVSLDMLKEVKKGN